MSNKKSRSSKYKSDKGKGNSDKEGESEKREHYDHGEQPQLMMGDERRIHEEILDRRMRGGAPPTPAAYLRAFKQWQRLPGAVVRSPTDVRPPSQKPSKTTDVSPAAASTAIDADEEEHQ